MPLVPCDRCAMLIPVGKHWSVFAFVDGEMVDWMAIACGKEHAELIRDEALPTVHGEPWAEEAARQHADISFAALDMAERK